MTAYGTHNSGYIGRFAPSPSGSLHFGSLIAALASYLDAKHHHGQWLVRIEDIDPPREEPGASQAILESLRRHELYWDGDILYQSSRLSAYESLFSQLKEDTYFCTCSRPRLLELRGIYDSRCLHTPPQIEEHTLCSTRLRLDRLSSAERSLAEHYEDIFQGQQHYPLKDVGDFILKRKDGLFAYQLAVVIDDIYQGITHIIRGSDLLSSTSRQRYLMQRLAQVLDHKVTLPTYGHIPVITNSKGQKFSKQHKSPSINNSNAFNNLYEALQFVGHSPPDNVRQQQNIHSLLQWGISHWDRKLIPHRLSCAADEWQVALD